jgi:hypothetical protein
MHGALLAIHVTAGTLAIAVGPWAMGSGPADDGRRALCAYPVGSGRRE